MNPKPPTHNAVVTKHNSLLPKLAKMGLSELRLLAFCLAHYDSRPEHRADDKTPGGVPVPQELFQHTASVQDLLDIFPSMDKKSAYAVVRQAVKGINAKPFEDTFVLPNGKTKDVLIYWFAGFEYYNDEGRFIFKLSPDIVDLVLSQDANFTRFRLKHVYKFKSALTWKLYELLKQWVVIGRWSVDLDALKMSLGIAGKYPRWDALKTRVIDPGIKQINDLSDIVVKYEKKTTAKAVSGIVFFINSKEDELKINDSSVVATIGDTNRDIRLLMGVGLNHANAEYLSHLAAEAGKDLSVFLQRVVERYDAKRDEKPSKQAYVYKALFNEFSPSLFDDLETSVAKKIDLDVLKLVAKEANIDAAKQRIISQENTKYGKEVFRCEYYPTRERGDPCPAIRPRTKKCIVCNRVFHR